MTVLDNPQLSRLDAPYDGLLEVLDRTGDSKHAWDRNNPAEVAIAKAAFDAALASGASVFVVKGKAGERGKRMREFDPNQERMIAVPQLVGG